MHMTPMAKWIWTIGLITAALVDVRSQCDFVFASTIPDFATTEVAIEVSGLTVDDLGAGQAICAVDMSFRHSYVGDLTITLTSPAGQSIQLLGPVTDQINPTNLITWDVRFTQCTFPAAPDAGFSAIWNNELAEPGIWTGA